MIKLDLYNGRTPPLDGKLWYPLIPGYEEVGQLVYVGKNVSGFKVGERVCRVNQS